MTEQEGVIKYELAFTHTDPAAAEIGAVNAWRHVLARLGLIGQHPDRYGGLGFGNLSVRTPAGFLITGTQTGHKARLVLNDYAEVTGWRLQDNVIEARGRTRPSSEALTHAAVYDARPELGYVFHGHSPRIWQQAARLGMTVTDPAVPYGTPAMAEEVGDKVISAACPDILAMGGHEDGIVAFGGDADETGGLLVRYLAAAIRLNEIAGTGN